MTEMVVLTDEQGLLGVVQKSQLTASGMDDVRLMPDVSRFVMTRRFRMRTGIDRKCRKQFWRGIDFKELTRPEQ